MRRVIFWKKDPASDVSVRPERRALSLKQSVILFAFVFILSASGALYIKRDEIKSQFLAQSVTAGFGLQKVDVNGIIARSCKGSCLTYNVIYCFVCGICKKGYTGRSVQRLSDRTDLREIHRMSRTGLDI